MQKFVDENAKSPNVSFRAIDMVHQTFRTHVQWTANTDILKAVVGLYGEAKVPQLVLSIFEEDVGKFEVSMHYA
jgi:hypothetical protein